ncbi:hypothetical protein K5Z09_004372 [Escherichia coli]|nr:hypothetical protein [Escherichia coli]EIM2940863.1 hypothetical protein [Escherichia coli]EIM2959668.1 hypothetical protein [Escherichia coli]
MNKSKNPVCGQQAGFCVYGSKLWEAALIDFSKLIREIRVMAEKLSTWKFILIWLVFVIMASGYFIGQIRWW